jgi:hypothetical protein
MRTRRALLTSGCVNVEYIVGCVCGNMHNEPSKTHAGGLYVDHPGYCPVGQVGTRCASARCLSLSCLSTVVAVEMRPTCSALAQHVRLPAHGAARPTCSALAQRVRLPAHAERTHQQSQGLKTRPRHWQPTLWLGRAASPVALLDRAIVFLTDCSFNQLPRDQGVCCFVLLNQY